MSTASRRTKWHPPPPSPKILHFPRSRRTRRKQPKRTIHHHRSNPSLHLNTQYLSSRGNLENLFNQENETPVVFLNSNSKSLAVERRNRVEEEYFGEYEGGFEKEKWMFQAEILRAECNFLRMERELALKKLERNKVKMEKTLRSAVQTLVSGKKKIFEGKNVNAVLEKEIEDLSHKLEELQKGSRIKDNEVRNCSNFDKKTSLLQRRLENLGELSDKRCLNESQAHDIDKSNDVDELRKNSSFASSASDSKGIECTFSTRQLYQEPILHEDNRCSGHCKAIVRKIVEQVRAETEQWSQMQEMLEKVRGEMEELQASRDFWENRAHNSDYEIQSLKHAVEEWKEKARGYEMKADELQLELCVLREELQKSKAQKGEVNLIPNPPQEQFEKENQRRFDEKVRKFENAKEDLSTEEKKERTQTNDSQPISLGKQLAKEKRMLLRSLKERRHATEKEKSYSNSDGVVQMARKRSPLKDIGNSSSLARQHGAVFPFDSPERKL